MSIEKYNDKIILVTGIAYYPMVYKPEPTYSKYQLDLVVDDETAAKLEGLGIKPTMKKITSEDGRSVHYELKSYSEKGHPGMIFTFRKNGLDAHNNEKPGPEVVDADGETPFTEAIGNGSTVRCSVELYVWEYKKKTGQGARLNGVQVLNHIPFIPDPDKQYKPELGFVKAKSTLKPIDL